MPRPRFRIKHEKNHPDGVLFLPRNVEAAKMLRDNLFHGVTISSDLLAPGASAHYRPSNMFYKTQFEYHGKW
jgi:hypothetical protein